MSASELATQPDLPQRTPTILRRPRDMTAYVVLVAALLLTALTTWYADRVAAARDLARFKDTTASMRGNVLTRIASYEALLRAASAFFAASDDVSRAEFDTFANQLHLQSTYPGTRGIGFARRILTGQEAELNARMRASGEPTFEVHGEAEQTYQPERFPIVYLAPRDEKNKRVFGYDMYSEPTRREAMRRARAINGPALTGRVFLRQEVRGSEQPGFLLYQPVYRVHAPAPPAFIGFVYCALRAGDLFQGILGTTTTAHLRAYDSSLPNPNALLYDSSEGERDENVDLSLTYTSRSEVAGRFWTLEFTPRPAFERGSARGAVPLVLCSGLLVSLLLFVLVQAQTQARITAELTAQDLAEAAVEMSRQQELIAGLNVRLQRAMTETHHRVKNNLQVIAAMLDMTLMEGEAKVDASELERLSRHIRSLAVVHDLLTEHAKQSGDVHHVSTHETLTRLLPLIQSMTANRPLRYKIADARMQVRQCTSLALVTNELVSNAIKHGRNAVEVNFRVKGAEGQLEVCDDGPGFPPGFDPESAANTGLDLVLNLSRWDLGGAARFETRSEGGGRVIVTMPLTMPEEADNVA